MRRYRIRDLVSSIPVRVRPSAAAVAAASADTDTAKTPHFCQLTALPENIIIFRLLNLGIEKYSAVLHNVQLFPMSPPQKFSKHMKVSSPVQMVL